MDCNGEVQCYINGVADQSINKNLIANTRWERVFVNELLRTSFVLSAVMIGKKLKIMSQDADGRQPPKLSSAK